MTDKELKSPHLFGRHLYDAELKIVAYYMVHPLASLRESAIKSHHFELLKI